MQNSDDIDTSRAMYALFKGEPKTGKSIAAHSYPKPYTLDLDGRMKSVKNYYSQVLPKRSFQFDSFLDMHDVLKRLNELRHSVEGFETIIFDGLTSFSDMTINAMIENRADSKTKLMRGGLEVAQLEDYGGEARALGMILDLLKAINVVHNVHVIVVAHVIRVEQYNPMTQKTHESRSLFTAGKKIAAKIPKDFDEAYHFDVNPSLDTGGYPDYLAYTRHAGNDWAGTALPNLPVRIDWTKGDFYSILMHHVRNAM